MPIPFTCPHCGSYTNVDDRFAGHSGPCAACGQKITIPTGPAAYPSPRPPQQASTGAGIGLVIGLVAVVVLVCGGGLVALLLPAVQAAREAARRTQCSNNLKQIALAMHNYHDTYKCFPSAVLTDAEGNPRRSWRVAVLPFLEQSPVYDRYDFGEPWDSPSNQALVGSRSSVYACPSDPAVGISDTCYVMITGKGTVGGEPNEHVDMQDISDGTSNTIMVIEVAGSGIPWLEPRDMTVDEAVAYITNPSATGRRLAHPGGVNVAMTDGSVRFLSSSIDPQMLRALLTRDDGQAATLP
ncbi:MAG: DUF1559 family PulG-like putative transporter [Thermoguttaceae bacterium]